MYVIIADLRHIYFLEAGYIRSLEHKKTIPFDISGLRVKLMLNLRRHQKHWLDFRQT